MSGTLPAALEALLWTSGAFLFATEALLCASEANLFASGASVAGRGAILKNGRTVIQAMRCPADHRARVGAIAASDVDRLLAEARASHFADETDAYTFWDDSEVTVLATYDGCTLKFAYGTYAGAATLVSLANLIDRAVGTGVLVP